jgi:hypothetical protein
MQQYKMLMQLWWPSAAQVPPYVAQRWRQAITRAGQSAVDEDARGEVLGQITLQEVSIALSTDLQVVEVATATWLALVSY